MIHRGRARRTISAGSWFGQWSPDLPPVLCDRSSPSPQPLERHVAGSGDHCPNQRNKSERKENVRQPQLCSMPASPWHAAKSSLTKLWGWQERGWFCCAAFREFAVQPGQPVVTTPVRALVQTGNLQPRASARSAAFERSSVGLTAEVGGCARPNHVLTHVVTLRVPRRFEFAGAAIVTVNKTGMTSNQPQDHLFITPVPAYQKQAYPTRPAKP